MPTVTPPKYTKQVMVLLEPEVSGEIYAMAAAAGMSASAMCRDLIAEGLEAGRQKWTAIAPSKAEIERLRAEHRRQGDEQTARRRGDDAERRKYNQDGPTKSDSEKTGGDFVTEALERRKPTG